MQLRLLVFAHLGKVCGEGNGNSLQDSYLENPMDRRAWWDPVQGGHKKSDTTEQLTHTGKVWASLVAQLVKNLPAIRKTWVLSLGSKDPLEEGMATHSSLPAWRIPMDRGAGQATVHGVEES